jgi:NAD(P)-dependent dehydrogenase (short-subunit alcohol dehydrogenase family)
MSAKRSNAIVTGAASGLGRALAVRLARDGWCVAICDIDDRGSEETLAQVRAAGGDGSVEHLDVTRVDEWQALGKRLQSAWPALDLLANNAGVAGAGEVGAFPLSDWKWVVDVNLWSTIYGCHTFVEWLKQNPDGAHVMNIASIAAVESAPPTAAYNVSKAAVVSLSETLYAQLLPHNVGVTVVCTGSFPTNINKTLRANNQKWRELLERLTVEATLTADDVADRAVRAMRRKNLYVVLPRAAGWRWFLKRLAPQAFLRGISRAVYRES